MYVIAAYVGSYKYDYIRTWVMIPFANSRPLTFYIKTNIMDNFSQKSISFQL